MLIFKERIWLVSENNTEGIDPFDPDVAPAVQLIVQMRIYDVLMAILTNLDKEAAANLYTLHSGGKVMGSLPWIDLSE
jgi:hypothetical protein